MLRYHRDKYFTPPAVAELYGWHPASIRKRCEDGRFTTAEQEGNRWFILKSDPLLQTHALSRTHSDSDELTAEIAHHAIAMVQACVKASQEAPK